MNPIELLLLLVEWLNADDPAPQAGPFDDPNG